MPFLVESIDGNPYGSDDASCDGGSLVVGCVSDGDNGQGKSRSKFCAYNDTCCFKCIS